MTEQIPAAPQFGDDLAPAHPSDETLRLMALRRSTTAAMLTGPGPTPDEVDQLLKLAARAPDHRRVVPFRFLVIEGQGLDALGDLYADAAAQAADDSIPAPELARKLAHRAPVVIFVISSVKSEHKTPEWEQILTAGAVCQNLLIASNAMGYAGQWLSEWIAYDLTIRTRLELGEHERIAGVFYLGSAKEPPKERVRPDVPALISRWPTS